ERDTTPTPAPTAGFLAAESPRNPALGGEGAGNRLVHPHPHLAVRLGLAPVRGIGERTAERVVAEREANGPFADIADLARRVRLTAAQLEALATAGALDCFGLERRAALWAAGVLAGEHATLPHTAVGFEAPMLPGMDELETAVADVWATGVSTDSFPTQFLRPELTA